MTEEKHRINSNILLGVVIFVGIVAVALSTISIYSVSKANESLTAARHAEYRICFRQMVVRAAANLTHDERQLAIYDCRSDLHGHPATRLTPKQQVAFERYVQTTPTSDLP